MVRQDTPNVQKKKKHKCLDKDLIKQFKGSLDDLKNKRVKEVGK